MSQLVETVFGLHAVSSKSAVAHTEACLSKRVHVHQSPPPVTLHRLIDIGSATTINPTYRYVTKKRAPDGPVTRQKLSMGPIRGPGPVRIAYTRAMSEHRYFPKKRRSTHIMHFRRVTGGIRVSVTQPSTPASMEYKVSIMVFFDF